LAEQLRGAGRLSFIFCSAIAHRHLGVNTVVAIRSFVDAHLQTIWMPLPG